MTNWCENLVIIYNEDRDVIKSIENAFLRDELLDAFIPCPKELEYLTSLKPNDGLVKKMVAKYGAEDWYLWRLDNWGTKWDTGQSYGTVSVGHPTKIELDVETAWTPPIPVFVSPSKLPATDARNLGAGTNEPPGRAKPVS